MRRLLAFLLLCAAGCSGFEEPTADRLEPLPLETMPDLPPPRYLRCRIQMSIDSPTLAGEFEGAVIADSNETSPVVRAQVFGDLGPKILDLTARRDRIVGYFPSTREGIDCALPDEAAPHLVTFMGASLLEEFMPPVARRRVTGIREEGGGSWLRLRPVIEGMESLRFMNRTGAKKRKLRWMYGITWDEEWAGADECRIAAPGLRIRVRILERTTSPAMEASAFELKLPPDVRLVAGSRK